MKVITVLQKVCEYLQLNDVRDYLIKLNEYYEKKEALNNTQNQDNNSSNTNENQNTNDSATTENESQQDTTNPDETATDNTTNDTNTTSETSDTNTTESSETGNETTANETESQLEKPTTDPDTAFDLYVLLECFNNVMKHISMKYLPLYHKEFVDVTQGYLDLGSLKYDAYKIKKICDQYVEYKVKIIEGLIPLSNGSYFVEYQYIPDSLKEDDDIIDFDNRLLVQGYIYGINSEFSLMRGDITGSQMWDAKYREIMEDVSRNVKNYYVKRSRWI